MWLTWLAWGLLGLNLILILLVPAEATFHPLWLISLVAWLVLTSFAAAAALMIRHRSFFSTWAGWTSMLVLMVLSGLLSQNLFPAGHPNLQLLVTILSLVSILTFGVATVCLLWYRDAGLGLLAGGLVAVPWALLFGWHSQGNLIDLFILAVNRSNEPPPLWWLNSLLCILCWVVPLGTLGFLGHTLRLVINEFRSDWKPADRGVHR